MKKHLKTIVFLSVISFEGVAKSEESLKLPIFVHYTHDGHVDAHLNLACEVGKTSSFSAPYTEQENAKGAPAWEIFVKPVVLKDGNVEFIATVLEQGKRIMTPHIKTNLGEPVSLTSTNPTTGIKVTLELKTQKNEGLAPIETLKYKPQYISVNDAITSTSGIVDRMEKEDLRTTVSYDHEIEFVGTEDFLQVIRTRLAEVDVETAGANGGMIP